MRNADYWRGRFKILEEAAHSEGDKSIDAIGKMYLEAQRTVQADIERWFGRFAENNEISLTAARKLLTSDELEEFQWTVDKYIEVGKTAGLSSEWQKKLENASAKFHVSRLEAIQTQIQQEIEKLFQSQQDEVNSLLKGIIEDSYTQTAYNIQKGIGVGWNITAIDEKKLNTLLTKPWTTDSRTFSDRIWLKKDELVANVQKELTQGLLRGDSQRKITDAIKNRFGVSQYQAGRLVHTETTYFNALSTQQAYRDLGVEEIEIVETLDSHTCETCRAMDGKVIPLAQYEPGVTVPPFHPNCRGTTCPYFDDMDGERAARDADGNVYYVPEDMSYEKWHKPFAENGSKKGLTAASKDDIITTNVAEEVEEPDVHTVGHIDIEKFRCVADDIDTDEVIITDERIQHIESHHPGHYEIIEPYLQAALSEPDYILKDKNANTGLILKEIEENGLRMQVVLRIHTSNDNPEFKNSIISAWKISESRWNNYVSNKKILYKRA